MTRFVDVSLPSLKSAYPVAFRSQRAPARAEETSVPDRHGMTEILHRERCAPHGGSDASLPRPPAEHPSHLSLLSRHTAGTHAGPGPANGAPSTPPPTRCRTPPERRDDIRPDIRRVYVSGHEPGCGPGYERGGRARPPASAAGALRRRSGTAPEPGRALRQRPGLDARGRARHRRPGLDAGDRARHPGPGARRRRPKHGTGTGAQHRRPGTRRKPGHGRPANRARPPHPCSRSSTTAIPSSSLDAVNSSATALSS